MLKRVVVIAIAAISAGASAQPSGTLNVFSASETPEDDFHISRPTDLGHLRFGAQVHLDYSNDPLVYETDLGMRDSEAARIVEHQLNATVGLSLGIFDRLVIFAGLPVVAVMDGDSDADLAALGLVGADGAGLGDAYLGARVRIWGDPDDAFALGLQLTGTFPTAGDQRFRGDEFLSLSPEALFELRPGAGSRIVLNVGATIREDATDPTSNLTFSDELTYGLGFAIPVWKHGEDPDRHHLDLHVQGYGSTYFNDLFAREATPFEVIGGGKYFHPSGLVFGAAAGAGVTRGFGAPDLRVIGTVAYLRPAEAPEPEDSDGDGILDDQDECPNEPEDRDEFEDANGCPDPDNDGDGILDQSDMCPNEPENINEWEDQDGCPDEIPDTDGDGLLDNADECPEQAEDADGFEDENGCPDVDNDGDGVLDDSDGCPMEPGPVENRGCPDADRDGDTVVDRLDNCPDEPGSPENQGCEERQQVVIQEGRLEILDKVYFRTNRDRIQRRSFSLLLNVAQVLNNHPEIQQVRVEGHTDTRGRREYNLDLSQRRAQAVVDFLVRRGEVAAERLVAQGFGPDQPIVADASSREEHAQNRRVEFNIVSGGEGIQQQNSGPGADTIDH
ncbi:MAG: OmpA family protein [Myxococcota bacterium]